MMRFPSFMERDMSDKRVLANQSAILRKLLGNQQKLSALMAGQRAIKANHAKILGNQAKILRKR